MKLDNFPHGTVEFLSATDGQAAHFQVSFMLICSHEIEGIQHQNVFQFGTRVQGDKGMTYKEVENTAAEQLPGLLRELADAVQADVDRANQS